MRKIFPLYTSGNKGFSDEPLVELDYRYEGRKVKIKIRYFFPGFTISDDKRSVFRRRRYRRWQKFQEVKMSGAGFYHRTRNPFCHLLGDLFRSPLATV